MDSYCFTCSVHNELGETQLEDYEIHNGMRPVWLNIHEAIAHNEHTLGSVDLLSSFLQQFVWGFYKAEPMWCSWLDNSSCIILMSYIPVAIHE